MDFRNCPALCSVVTCALVMASQAHAKDAAIASAAPPNTDIIVTASQIDVKPTKQATATFIPASPLDTPATISVVPDQLLRDRGITGLDEALRNVPGIQVAQSDSTGRPAGEDAVARGFSIASPTFRDGLRQWSYGNAALEFYDRVEVLKGLSGMQAGLVGPAGILNFITKRPQAANFVHTDALVSNWGGDRFMADVNIADVGVAGIGVRAVGVYENLATYIRGFNGHRWSGQIAASMPLGESTKLDLDVSQSNQNSDYQSPINYYNGNPTALPHVDRRTFLGQSYSGYPSRTTSTSAKITRQFGDRWTLIVAGQYQRFSRLFHQCGQASINDPDPTTGEADYDPGCEPRNSPNRTSDTNLPYYNGEIRLTGGGRLLGLQNDVAIGYQYSQQKYRPVTQDFFYTAITSSGPDVYTQNIYDPRSYTIPTLYSRSPRYSFNSYYLVIDQGIYLQDRITFTEHLALWAGGRYVFYHNPVYRRPVTSAGDGTSIVDADNNVISGDGSTTFGKPILDPSNTYRTNTFTPTVSLVWKPLQNVTAYMSYNQSLETGGVAPDTAKNAGQIFGPIRTNTYEAGLKWDIGKALLTAALFRIERPLQTINSSNVFTQNGLERHQGIEIAASGQIAPNLTVVGGLMLMKATQRDTNDPTLEGNRPAGVSDFVANLYAEYALPFVPGLVLSAGDYHLGDQYLFGDGVFKVKGHDQVNAGGRYVFTLGGTRITARVNIENLFNTYYDTVAGNGGGSVYVGAPRTARFSIAADF